MFDIDDILCYSKRQIYLPFTIAASSGCERARKEISRFAARARRGVNDQNEIRFDVYDIIHVKTCAAVVRVAAQSRCDTAKGRASA